METSKHFDAICGDCDGVDMMEITETDIREQGEKYNATEEEIESAIKYITEYQEENK
jgi:uncharacterized protein (UPF0128 family)